ncbi:hypothetical protein, partial [Klebsiella variicola]|uniref:hypothetical protein n=1 Tax=Klebsiella variicola TaxID=244366 RepID=UPI0039C3BFF0
VPMPVVPVPMPAVEADASEENRRPAAEIPAATTRQQDDERAEAVRKAAALIENVSAGHAHVPVEEPLPAEEPVPADEPVLEQSVLGLGEI